MKNLINLPLFETNAKQENGIYYFIYVEFFCVCKHIHMLIYIMFFLHLSSYVFFIDDFLFHFFFFVQNFV
jgi:hypothetical protein